MHQKTKIGAVVFAVVVIGAAGLVLGAERIRQLLERELKRARLAGEGLPGRRFDPHRELRDLVRVLKQVHHNRSVDIECRVENGVPSFGDREDMLELLGNLLDNACKWASASVLCRLAGDRELRRFGATGVAHCFGAPPKGP